MTEHREFYRKKVSSPGFLILPSGELQFQIRDLSIDGFQAHFEQRPPVETDALVHIRLPGLNLEGNATVIRVLTESDGGCSLGFLFGELVQADRGPVPLPVDEIPDVDDMKF